MGVWNLETLDVLVDYDDVIKAHEEALRDGKRLDTLNVPALVDIDDALEEATVDQLREALGREEAPGYTQDQLTAIEEGFAAVLSGDLTTAGALIGRIFEHEAQRQAAERGLSYCARIAA